MVCFALHRASGVSLRRCPGYRPVPGKRERVFQEVVRWVDKQEESRSSLFVDPALAILGTKRHLVEWPLIPGEDDFGPQRNTKAVFSNLGESWC